MLEKEVRTIANANLMKEINLNHVRQVMKRVETATKPQLAALTKLSVVTINSLIKELHEYGEILEDEVAPSSGGRPALSYRYNYDYSLALILYIKEQQEQVLISASVVNLEERVLLKDDRVMPAFDHFRFFELMAAMLELYPSVKVIGVGIPGQVVNGEIIVSSLTELTGYRMEEEIEGQFGLPVLIENDINAAISGYCARLERDDEQSVVGIYFPAKLPPGLGIFLNGSVIKGNNGMAGEVKFLPGSPDWHKDMNAEEFAQEACRMMHTVNALLAPHEIVIYQDRIQDVLVGEAWETYRRRHGMPTYPDVVLQKTFQQDFEAGMRWLALRELDPGLKALL